MERLTRFGGLLVAAIIFGLLAMAGAPLVGFLAAAAVLYIHDGVIQEERRRACEKEREKEREARAAEFAVADKREREEWAKEARRFRRYGGRR